MMDIEQAVKNAVNIEKAVSILNRQEITDIRDNDHSYTIYAGKGGTSSFIVPKCVLPELNHNFLLNQNTSFIAGQNIYTLGKLEKIDIEKREKNNSNPISR